MRRLLRGAAVAALTIAFEVSGAAKDRATITLAAVYNLSGSQSGLDIPSAKGARLAATQANATGGVLGRDVALTVIDGSSKPDIIAARTRAFIDDNTAVSALLGLSDTDMVLAAAPVAAASHRVFLTSGATSPKLPGQVPDWLFLACFGDNVQAAAAAEWAYRSLAARSAVVLYNQSMAYTRLLHGYFETRFEGLGGTIAARIAYDPVNPAAALDRLPEADMVYLAAGPDDAVAVARLLRGQGVSAPIVGGDGLDTDALVAVPDAKDIYFTTHAFLGSGNPDPTVAAFVAAYEAAYPGEVPDAFSALGYDAVNLLLAAIAAAESDDPDTVRRALAATRGFKGITGEISFNGGQIPRKSVTIIEITDGRRRYVDAIVPDKVPTP